MTDAPIEPTEAACILARASLAALLIRRELRLNASPAGERVLIDLDAAAFGRVTGDLANMARSASLLAEIIGAEFARAEADA